VDGESQEINKMPNARGMTSDQILCERCESQGPFIHLLGHLRTNLSKVQQRSAKQNLVGNFGAI
jgi:hypothetical protein